jgi:hypothetical protein
MIMESFDRQTLAKMEIALEQACGLVSTGSQKHRLRRYIAKRIIECASNGNRDLDSLTTAALAAAKELNASREQKSEVIILPDIGSARLSLHDMRSAGAHSNVGLPSVV